MSKSSPEPLFFLRGHQGAVNTLNFHQTNENLLFSGGSDGILILWDLKKRKSIIQIQAHSIDTIPGGIIHMEQMKYPKQISPKEENNLISVLVTQGRDQSIKVWDLSTENFIEQIPLFEFEIPITTFCPFGALTDTSIIATISDPATSLDIFSLSEGKVISRWKIENETKKGMTMDLKVIKTKNIEEKYVALSFEDGSIDVWSSKEQKLIQTIKIEKDPILCFTLSTDLKNGICGTTEKTITQFEFNLKKSEFKILKTFDLNHGGIQKIILRSDFKIFVTAGWDHRIRIFDFKKKKPLAILKAHTESVHSLDFSNFNKSFLASGSKDKRIAIWSIY